MKASKIVLFSVILFFATVFLQSCGSGSVSSVKYKADVSDLKADVEILRFDRDFFTLDTANISEGLEKLKEKYGDFVKTFLVDIFNGGKQMPLEEIAKAFLSIPEAKQLADTIQKAFPDLKAEEKGMEEVLKYAKHYFGDQAFPIKKIYATHTLYTYGMLTGGDFAMLGLDFFLGENHVGYAAVDKLRHQYIKRALNRAHCVGAFAEALSNAMAEDNLKPGGTKLIDMMIYEGKKFYIKVALMPEAADSVIYRMSDYQILYCKKGEAALWEHLGKENLLFSSKKADFQKYISEGPFNPQIDLPGNSGSWLGTQIVMQAANRMRKEIKAANPTMSAREIDRRVMQQILQEQDSQKFIQKYKPSR